jgi:hypothetical protein
MTAFTKALFYPWIDIENEGWLKNAMLYWDSIQTIVPASITRPYSTRTAEELSDHGLLEPLFVESEMPEIKVLAADVLTYMDSPEGIEVLTASQDSKYHHIHPSKLPEPIQKIIRLHPDKLASEVRYILEQSMESHSTNDWFYLDERFLNFYMTLLATRLSERRGFALLTDIPVSDKMANSVRLNTYRPVLGLRANRRRHEFFRPPYEHVEHYDLPSTLVEGVMSDLILNSVRIFSDTPVEKILKFKERHADELGLFRSHVAELTSSITDKQPIDRLRQQVNDKYINEFLPNFNNFRKALKSSKIKHVVETSLKVSFFSTSTASFMPALFGLSIPQALLVGAGMSLVATSVLYNTMKEEKLRESPYSYLLATEKEFI